MENKLYEYELCIDFMQDRKEKVYAEHRILGETKDQIAYVNSRWCGEQVTGIWKHNDTDRDRSTVNVVRTYKFDSYGFNEIKSIIITDKEPKDKEKMFKKLEKELEKFIGKTYKKLFEFEFDFSGVNTAIYSSDGEYSIEKAETETEAEDEKEKVEA